MNIIKKIKENIRGPVPLFLNIDQDFIIEAYNIHDTWVTFELKHKKYEQLSGTLNIKNGTLKAQYTNGKFMTEIEEILLEKEHILIKSEHREIKVSLDKELSLNEELINKLNEFVKTKKT